MTIIVGGLRAQLIRESIYQCLHGSLSNLGWFDPGRRHKPISFPGVTETNENEIPINRIALNDEDNFGFDLEMGSTAVETRWTYWIDFYAENDSLGKHVIYDVRDILGGRMSSIGRSDASIAVYDYTIATPAEVFKVQIEDVVVDKAHDFPKPYQKHWYACRFTVVDAYHDDSESATVEIGTIGTGGGVM
jgi:hypothetical protein